MKTGGGQEINCSLTRSGVDDKNEAGMDEEEKKADLLKIGLELDPGFIREHAMEAERIYNSLPLGSQLLLALTRRGRERLELILLSGRASSLVRKMPEAELYFTIKEIGEEDALPLLALASVDQLTYIFDLEFWEQDLLSAGRISKWLELLRVADEDQLQSWLKRANPEILIGALQKLMQVFVVEPDNLGSEPWRDLDDIFTLDDQYYFKPHDNKYRQVIERTLIYLREPDAERFYGILDQVRLVLSSEVETMAHRVRQGRLEDYGFYDFKEAFEIYRYLSPEDQDRLLKNPERPEPVKETGIRYPILLSREIPSLLAQSLRELSDSELEDFYHQFAVLANKLLVADALDLTELKNLKLTVEKVYGYLEIGLSVWSEGKPERAAEILKRQWLQHIFQAGFSEVQRLRFRAQRIERMGWFKNLGRPFDLFGETAGKRLEALIQKRPKFYSGEKALRLREFRSRADLKLAEQSVAEAEFLARIFFEALGLSQEKLKRLISGYPLELTFQVILATLLVSGVGRGKPNFEPITAEELSRFIAKSMAPEKPPRKIDPLLKDEFLRWLMKRMLEAGISAEARVRELHRAVIESLELELGRLKKVKKIEPKLISSVILSGKRTVKTKPRKKEGKQ